MISEGYQCSSRIASQKTCGLRSCSAKYGAKPRCFREKPNFVDAVEEALKPRDVFEV